MGGRVYPVPSREGLGLDFSRRPDGSGMAGEHPGVGRVEGERCSGAA
jgi:hypothetical protein